MVSDNFYQGFMSQSVGNANREIERANIKIAELRDLRREDAAEIEELERKLKEAYESIETQKRWLDGWNAHYQALEAERDAGLKVIDDCMGADKNPLRRQAYADDVSERIPVGSRSGQRVTVRDHIYFARLSELVKTRFPHLGSWRELLRTSNIFE